MINITLGNFKEKNFDLLKSISQECSNKDNCHIVVEKGIYTIGNEKTVEDFNDMMTKKVHNRHVYDEYNSCMSFKNANNITLDFSGSTIYLDGFLQPFEFINCKNVTIKNITVDVVRPAFCEGIISGIKLKSSEIEVKIFNEYKIDGGEPVASFQSYDTEKGVLTGVCPFMDISDVKLISDHLITVTSSEAKNLKIGDVLILRHTYNYRPAVEFIECDYCRVENFYLLGLTGMGLMARRSSNLYFENLQVKPSLGKIMSITVDATHFISCSGDLSFNNCYFEGMGDDAMNAHSFYYTTSQIINEKALKVFVAHRMQPDYKYIEYPCVGDEFEIIKRNNLLPYYSLKAISVSYDNKTRETVIEFDKGLPNELSPDDLLGNVSKCVKLSFTNCVAKNLRGRAILIQTRNALVDNCIFENCTGQGIHIDTAEPWMEAIGTRNIIIRNTKFINCGNGSTNYCDANAIVVETECAEKAIGVHKNIVIENNLFVGSIKPAIYLSCAEDVIVRGNRQLGKAQGARVCYCKNVTFKDNELNELVVEDNCEAVTVINK